MSYIIRQEQIEDYELTEIVVERAFLETEHSDKKEHKLVARIRNLDTFIPELSLVAFDTMNNKIVGHILLSKIIINQDKQMTESLALASVSVLPEYQNIGIGKSLIVKASYQAKELGYQSIIVLGHPEYYPKFGFKQASEWGIRAPFEAPDEAFMATELYEGALENISGVVEYPSVFFE